MQENTDKKEYEVSEIGKEYMQTTRIMLRVFAVLVVICFLFSVVIINSSDDDTTIADRDKPFVMSSGEVFVLETQDGLVEFSLKDVEPMPTEKKDYKRFLWTYQYQVKQGCVDLSKLAFAASYVDDGEDPFGLCVIPYDKGNDIGVPGKYVEKGDVATGHLLVEVPKYAKKIYTDIGGSASTSGRPAWIVYDVSFAE